MDRIRGWLAVRAERKHRAWLKRNRVMAGLPKPDPRTIVHNTRGPL